MLNTRLKKKTIVIDVINLMGKEIMDVGKCLSTAEHLTDPLLMILIQFDFEKRN